ncbi:glycosyltransferase family 4 protein [Coleofasciculus sp. G2-EDA-02]|uniref:glycosyltransferase family 4 protein n=1 Tax=Coleofasciculus sp. G2-EDA-02 TaxID=3069529 RepID=UPI0032F78E2A
MAKVVVLTEIFFPEQTSTGYLLTKIAMGLAEEYDVQVITGIPTNFGQKINHDKYEVVNGVEIFRCHSTNFNKNHILGRLINSLSSSAAILLKCLIRCKSTDVVLVVTNPPFLPFIALLLKVVKGCNFVLLMHDIYPEALVAMQILTPSSILVKAWLLINRVLYSQAYKIITLGRDMNKLLKPKVYGNYQKIYCIPNWADNETISSTEKGENELLKKLDITDYFVVLYAGNMGRTHGVEYIAKAAEILNKDNHIHFIFLGFGAKKIWLENYINSQKLNNLSLISLYDRPRSEQIVSLNACDVAIISFLKGMAGISVPSRMYNHMAAGKPIIALTDDWSELAEVIREEEIGWIVKPGDVEGLLDTIKLAAAHPELCAEMGARAEIAAKTKYTFAQADKKYKELFREVFDTFIKETRN